MSRLAVALAAWLLAAVALTGCTPQAPSGTLSSAASSDPSVSSLAPAGATETARVVRVVDGDTVVIDRGRGSERLRYIGIDAPESVREDSPIEFMGLEASAANERLVEGRDVTLETDVSDVDQYGRLLRYVWLRDGDAWTFVNLELVRRGFANALTYPPDVRWTDALREAERQARDARDGLWGPPTPAP